MGNKTSEKPMPKPEDMPHISVNAQYIKDFSFENPNAPKSLTKMDSTPQIDLALDLKVNKVADEGEGFYEVEIIINAKAQNDNLTLFVVDIVYAGVFHLINIPDEQKDMILAVHCPALIFPYARKIVADVTQDGGFQPLMIDPIDFGVLYAKKLSESSEGN